MSNVEGMLPPSDCKIVADALVHPEFTDKEKAELAEVVRRVKREGDACVHRHAGFVVQNVNYIYEIGTGDVITCVRAINVGRYAHM